MDNETREEIKTLLGNALVSLQWKEDETAIEYIKCAYNMGRNRASKKG